MRRFLSAALALLTLASLLASSGCSVLPVSNSTQTGQPETSPPTDTPQSVTVAPLTTPTETPTGPTTLVVWLPPQFDPEGEDRAADLMRVRLSEFSQRRPGFRVDVRIKSVNVPGGMMDSLTAASAAAPLALPDLVLAPRPILENAALKGLLQPMGEYAAALQDPDWYPYALELAGVQNTAYGLPFVGDALALVYRPESIAEPPSDWNETLASGRPLIFPAADPDALFTLLQYQAAGGVLRDEEDRPTLDPTVLELVLSFYQQAEQIGVMPFWLTQYQDEDGGWEAFTEARSDLVSIWTSQHMETMLADTDIVPLPTPDGTTFTLATGWAWGLASPHEERHEIAIELAEFLSETDFTARWSEAAGYLPARSSALQLWSDASLGTRLDRIAGSAVLVPPSDVLTALGPPLQQATVQVLKEQSEAEDAAREALEVLSTP